MTSELDIQISDRIAIITLNRPDKRNALYPALIDALVHSVRELDADPDVDVSILTGAGRVFCAGLDLDVLAGRELDIGEGAKQGNPWPARTKPLIGAINGAAVTGGLELALCCDFLIASEHAKFGDTHARVGILPFWGLTARLPALIGLPDAIRMSVTGNFLNAQDALRLGLVTEVVPAERLLERAKELAADIVSNDQAAVRAMMALYGEFADATGTTEMATREQRAAIEWNSQERVQQQLADRVSAIISRGRKQ